MRNFLAPAFAFASLTIGASAASACVNNLSQNGAHLLVNNCPYTVVASFRASDGEDGQTSYIRSGGIYATGISNSENLQWWYCEANQWDRGRCRLP
jgi:hypothetical protein